MTYTITTSALVTIDAQHRCLPPFVVGGNKHHPHISVDDQLQTPSHTSNLSTHADFSYLSPMLPLVVHPIPSG
jgi:hypothetical protein